MQRREEYETLHGIRGVAALAVVFYHASPLLGVHLAPHGYLAVDLFFALSGFVVALAYDGRLTHGWSAWDVVRARLIRFYPLYALGLAIGLVREAALVATHHPFALGPVTLPLAIAAAALFVPFPRPQSGDLYSTNVPSWSLACELFVNVAYALCFRWLSPAVLRGIAIVSGVALCAAIVWRGSADMGALGVDLFGGVLRTIFSFTIGVILYRTRLRIRPIPAWAILLLTAAGLAAPSLPFAYDLLFIFTLSPFLVVAGVSVEPPRWLAPAGKWLGDLSFPIYAIHWPLLALAQSVQRASHVPGWLLGALLIGVTMAVCPLLIRVYDRPAQTWLKARFAARNDRAAEAAP